MTKQFAELHVLASPFELDIRRGQFVAFLGPSRCGKTTSMRMLDRLDVPSGGEIRLEGLPVGQPDRRMNFAGKAIMITGASRGIGLAIAEGFAAAGASLYLLADDDAVIGQARRLNAIGQNIDITDAAGVAALFEAIPRVDVLINNAGLERLTPLDDASDAAAAYAANITGQTLGADRSEVPW